MPIEDVPKNETFITGRIGEFDLPVQTEPEVEGPDPTTGEIFGAAFRIENPIVSFASREQNTPSKFSAINRTFDPFDNIDGYEDFSDRFIYANNDIEVSAVKSQIDREIQDRQILQAGGLTSFISTLAAGVFDPINFIPVGGVAYKTYRGGGSILRMSAATAMAGSMSMTASEASLHATQMTRTFEESAINVAAGTVFSGLLGAGAGAYGKFVSGGIAKPADEIIAQLDKDLTVLADDIPDPLVPGELSLTKAELKADTSIGAAEKNAAFKIKGALGLEKAVRFQDPLLRTGTSQNIDTRRTSARLATPVLKYEENALGLARPLSVEDRVNGDAGVLAFRIKEIDKAYKKYKKNFSKASKALQDENMQGDVIGANRGLEKLSRRRFNEEVAMAARRGDTHEIPEVMQAAQSARKVLDPYKDKAIELGIFPEDIEVKTAESYLHRIYNKEKIIARRPEFEQKIFKWLKEKEGTKQLREFRVNKVNLQKLNKEELNLVHENVIGKLFSEEELAPQTKANLLDDILEAIKGKDSRDIEIKISPEKLRTDEQLQQVTEDVVDRILGTPDGRLPYDITTERIPFDTDVRKGNTARAPLTGPFKERVLDIPDEMIEEFLENDIERLLKASHRTMSPDLALMEEFGDINMTTEIKQIKDDWNLKIKAADTERQRKKFQKRKDEDIRDIAAMRDRIRGIYAVGDGAAPWARVGNTLKSLQYLRVMGGIVVSSMADVARPVMVKGLLPVMNDGLIPLTRNINKLRPLKDELTLAGAAIEDVMNSRVNAIAEIMDDFGRGTMFERATQVGADRASKIFAISQWNQGWKEFSGLIVMNGIKKDVAAISAGKATKKQIERLAAGTIDEQNARIIHNQIQKHGRVEGGMTYPNTLDWDTDDVVQGALRRYRAAITQDVNKIIVTPGQDKPLFMSTNMGSFMGQFRSFFFASMQRVTLSGLQDRDIAAMNGLIMSVGMGMAVTAIKNWQSGRPMPDNPAAWIAEGVDRSGITGWLFDANNMVEKITRGAVGVSKLTGGQPMSRFQSRNLLEAYLGPSLGILQDVGQIAGSAASQDWTTSDTRAARRLLPFQNLVWTRQLLDKVENEINDQLGVPGAAK